MCVEYVRSFKVLQEDFDIFSWLFFYSFRANIRFNIFAYLAFFTGKSGLQFAWALLPAQASHFAVDSNDADVG
jgi:hypothetical protein